MYVVSARRRRAITCCGRCGCQFQKEPAAALATGHVHLDTDWLKAASAADVLADIQLALGRYFVVLPHWHGPTGQGTLQTWSLRWITMSAAPEHRWP
jgi:hypothetical protein